MASLWTTYNRSLVVLVACFYGIHGFQTRIRRIMTPQGGGSDPIQNPQAWPVPFYSNNGLIITPSSVQPVQTSQPVQPVVTPATPVVTQISTQPPATIGWSSTLSPFITSPVVPQPLNRISQEKCIEYSSSRRSARKSQVTVFIIGGQSSRQKEFPHMAALGYGVKSDNQWLCGGSLISENYILTAAHCLTAPSLGAVRYVRLGTTTLQTETLDSADYDVVRRIPYPTYVNGRQYDDIALLQLDRPVQFTEYIQPICLFSSTDLANVQLIATGWGKTSNYGSIAKDLQKVDLDYVPNDVCLKAYSVVPKDELPYGIIDTSQVCAGAQDGSKDTCQGDSGGPLQVQQDGRLYIVGITSFGIGCGKPGIPGVYTRVSNYLPWIEQTVWGR
ncbi:venom protease-like isoform X2 [Diabrotica undecimpunctata]|uniref:venom protease-like isoform X2 n=1 Tax=Diabrotica undecimpunctata TaxID=50387 RepID=UPI003B6374B8